MANVPPEDIVLQEAGDTELTLDAEARELRQRILSSLARQGFIFDSSGKFVPVTDQTKHHIRQLHREAREAAIARARPALAHHESSLLRYFASGREVIPERIRPVLKEVRAGTEEELLFRYAKLHWSIPTSAGYGRRLRFLVFDEWTGKLLGLFGLGDPVFALGPRDTWIGWDKTARRARLRHVLDAFVVGAVPPYADLLCGKLVALLLTSTEVREVFAQRYGGRSSWISNRPFDGQLALITTISALGRSSLYNRLTFGKRRVFESVGFTAGSGEFHFANGLYRELFRFATIRCSPRAKDPRWGSGWRNRRELIRTVLPHLGLSPELVYHGVRREIFVAPLAENARAFLRGDDDHLIAYETSVDELFAWFRKRWLLPRASRNQHYRTFEPESLRLWD